ncbi:MAG: hypothetical protein FJW40_19955 [Acidobacteria bacterium]|nr:hypothetical protein [Acidobacteriota bacterium]
MQLTDVYLGLGQDTLEQLLKTVSLGKLRSYQLFDRMKARLHLAKLNADTLRKSAPRLWTRLENGEQELAQELAQAILISHMDMIVAVLDELGIPHEDGFFQKDLDAATYLTGGWRERVYEKFNGRFPRAVLLFYLNHLAFEVARDETMFRPAE